jgi:UDP-glucose 4-epimerase
LNVSKYLPLYAKGAKPQFVEGTPFITVIPLPAGRVFNVTDGEFHTLNEIIESICSALGRKPPWLSLPIGPTRIVAGLIEKGANTIGIKSPVTRGMIDKYTEDIAVDGSRIRTELGFKPQYDLRSSWQETVQEMRRMGEL